MSAGLIPPVSPGLLLISDAFLCCSFLEKHHLIAACLQSFSSLHHGSRKPVSASTDPDSSFHANVLAHDTLVLIPRSSISQLISQLWWAPDMIAKKMQLPSKTLPFFFPRAVFRSYVPNPCSIVERRMTYSHAHIYRAQKMWVYILPRERWSNISLKLWPVVPVLRRQKQGFRDSLGI